MDPSVPPVLKSFSLICTRLQREAFSSGVIASSLYCVQGLILFTGDGDQFSRGEHSLGSIPVVSLVLGVFGVFTGL